jgi:hypothetical protein
MASVGLALAALQSDPSPGHATGAPQPSAGPAQAAPAQDSVTLLARTAEGQPTHAENGNAAFGEASAFFFAEAQTFRASNGSGGKQASTSASIPELPVKVETDPVAAQNGRNATSAAQAEAVANIPQLANQVAQPTATLSQVNTSPAASQNGGPQTPLAELDELDRSLQQLGIDPQSISLFNRMAMLLYANDPAALKLLVQTLQSGAQQLAAQNPGASAANLSLQVATATVTSGAQSHNAVAPAPNANAGAPAQSEAANSAQSAAPTAVQAAATSAAPPPSLSAQIADLNFALGLIGSSGVASNSPNPQSGQFLNVTA